MSEPANLNALWARALVQELFGAGVREAVVCPGSRSTPLALACAGQPGLQVRSVIDERCAAFVALGAAKATGRPALVLATSGSAGAHFFPALLEAEAANLPLLAITADRPPELHGWGAPQTLDQHGLFGRHLRFFADLGVPEPDEAALRHLRATAALAAARALQPPRGPVHLNAPFREPLAPEPGPLPRGLSLRALDGPAARLRARSDAPDPAALDGVARELCRRPRGLLVCGPRDAGGGLAEAAAALASALGYAVLAEAASQVRSAPEVVTTYDSLLRHAPFSAAARPDAVVRLGGVLTSKLLQRWLDDCGAFQVQLSDDGALHDPAHVAAEVIEGDAALACAGLAERVRALGARPGPLTRLFGAAEARARAALDAAFAASPALTEPRVAREVAAALPAGAQLLVASSMPVRDLDAFAAPGLRARVLASRGLNGIDGLVSTAAGAAAASGRPTALLLGDLALLHDLGGLVSARRLRVPLTVVCVNNDGGGIFHFLPVAEAAEPAQFEALFGTPHGADLAGAAALCGARLRRPETPAGLRAAVGEALGDGLQLIEVRTSRQDNVAVHRGLQQAVLSSLGDGPWA